MGMLLNCLHWSVNMVVVSVLILSQLGLNYIYSSIIYTELASLSDGPLQCNILATPLGPVPNDSKALL